VSVASCRTDLLRSRDLWLDARRGTAGVVYAAMLQRLLHRGRTDVPADHAELVDSIALATLDAAALLSGVAQEAIESCVEKMANADRVIVVYDLDDTLERSTDDLATLATILLTTGRLDKDGQGILLLNADGNAEGARLAGIAGELHLGQIRTGVVMFENPLGDCRAAGSFERVRSLVVIDHFMTETARAADVVLPASTLAETDGTVVSSDGRFTAIRRARAPVSGLTTGDVVAGLCSALGRPVHPPDAARLRAEAAARMGVAACDVESARSHGNCLARTPRHRVLPRSLRLDPAASSTDRFSYATLDGELSRKLRGIGLV